MDRTELRQRLASIQQMLDENSTPEAIHEARDSLYYDVLRAIAKSSPRSTKTDLQMLAVEVLKVEHLRRHRPGKFDHLTKKGKR